MPSPFRGMDPYLQKHWRDVHTMLIGYTRDAIQPQLPEDLVARAEESVNLEATDELLARRSPGVVVVESPIPWEAREAQAEAGTLTAPILLEVDTDPVIDRFIQITDAEGNRVVTTIELLSPWNKETPGLEQYLHKRQQLLQAHTNLMEIDLVRGGKWWSMVDPYYVPAEHRSTYRVTVKRATPLSKLELYPIWLPQRLPTVGVPLRSGETDVKLDLQRLIEQIYRNGRYERTDYQKPCDPPFEGPEAQWAEKMLREAGRR